MISSATKHLLVFANESIECLSDRLTNILLTKKNRLKFETIVTLITSTAYNERARKWNRSTPYTPLKLFKNLRKYLPTVKEIQQYRYLHIFGDSLKQQELWTFNRQSTAKGVAIGLFCAFLPMPFEIVPAIFLAALMRGNLPFAIAGIWISNPVTWVPLYSPCYLLGAHILQIEPVTIDQVTIFELGLHYVALWLGCLIVGIAISVSAHFTISFAWRSQVRQRWKRRQHLRSQRSQKSKR